MMDMLPSSIGILTWGLSLPPDKREKREKRSTGTGAGDDDEKEEEDEEDDDSRYFEPVLHKGDCIPSVGVRTFTLADLRQKTVSVDVYEEIEEYVLSSASSLFSAHIPSRVTVSGKEISAETASLSSLKAVPATVVVSVKAAKGEVTYRYDLIGTYDFLVPKPLAPTKKGEIPKVDVVFTMSAEGALVFSVRPHLDPKRDREGVPSELKADADAESSNMIWVLGSYLSLMFLLYIVVKILIQSPATKEHVRGILITSTIYKS